MLEKVHHSLVEGVILALHVSVVDGLPQDVLVERPGEVAVEKLVVVDGLGDHPPDEPEVVQVVGVHVGAGVGFVGDPVPRRSGEQGVVWVEHIPGDDDVEFSQEPPGVLSLFSLKLDVEISLEVLGRAAVEFPEGVLKDVLSAEMDHDVLSTEPAVVDEFQLVPEVAPLDVKVEYLCVVDEDGKGALRDGDRALPQNLVQDCSVLLCVWGRVSVTIIL